MAVLFDGLETFVSGRKLAVTNESIPIPSPTSEGSQGVHDIMNAASGVARISPTRIVAPKRKNKDALFIVRRERTGFEPSG
jgi:hypothetical protein